MAKKESERGGRMKGEREKREKKNKKRRRRRKITMTSPLVQFDSAVDPLPLNKF